MRPPRLLLLLLCFIAFPIFLTFLSLLSAHPRDADSVTAGYGTKSSRLRALFSFHTPASLFPPSAIISLTDDNSTFFLARPAAFGPALPSEGLSSQLWVGSGFGDDNSRKTELTLSAEGELGCSDVPGWSEDEKKPRDEEPSENKKKSSDAAIGGKADQDKVAGQASNGNTKRASEDGDASDQTLENTKGDSPSENDGTDDHLHHPLPESNPAEAAKPGQPADHESINDKSKPPTHADIQSLQESAEIAGKVVLLSRGGCGFLEKVKWVQRRGGVALIVGDDARGEPLITMYARGDTSNVTIPALFTSHTTAHLLSSLIPPETPDDQGADGGKKTKHNKPKQKAKEDQSGPTFTPKAGPKPTDKPVSINKGARADQSRVAAETTKRSWLGTILSFFGWKGGAYYPWQVTEDSRRPPSSGNIDWVLLEDWDEKMVSDKSSKLSHQKPTTKENTNQAASHSKESKPSSKSRDDFVIGVHDWRDPDVLVPTDKQDTSKSDSNVRLPGQEDSQSSDSKSHSTGKLGGAEALKGGSITPGSGEYDHAGTSRSGNARSDTSNQASSGASNRGGKDGSDNGWFSHLLSSKASDQATAEQPKISAEKAKTTGKKSSKGSSNAQGHSAANANGDEQHEGLWVTLTPATMSASPFFDTLLVLVVSPLVTLTVVYALLLLRSRIRRRRWRAPKSVVDRLPVRVYHTMSTSSSTTSSQIGSPTTSSPTSPLLRSTSRTVPAKNRPRSQTTSGALPSIESSGDRASTSSYPAKEKGSNAPLWRKRYTGRQVECVVCLEEYIDGQSRVMSLPCGHEFHADCM